MNLILIILLLGSCPLLSLSLSLINNKQFYNQLFKGPSPDWYSDLMIEHGSYLIESYNKLSGKELVNMELYNKDSEKAIKEMFMNSNRIVLSHGIQKDNNGPVLNYGNTAALKLFAADWDSLTTMPSRYTADTEVDREIRQQFMDTVSRQNYVSDYTGIRIGLNKVKFVIKEAEVWNIIIDNNYIGQAATFEKYEFL